MADVDPGLAALERLGMRVRTSDLAAFTMPDDDIAIDADELIRQPPKPRATAGVSAAELQRMSFPPVRWVVPDLIPEGLTLLAGRPKLGKSWLVLGVAIAVASDGIALGSIHVDGGPVLYLALEDNLRRLQSRMQQLLPNSTWPAALHLETSWPRLGEGCIEAIEAWLDANPGARMVVIDTLARVRPSGNGRQTLYTEDYAAVAPLQDLAGRRNIAILLIHHDRKSEADDVFDTVSGTLGLTGGCDNVVVLHRKGELLKLTGRGRDMPEFDKAMSFDKATGWFAIEGDAGTIAKTGERQAILETLATCDGPMALSDIAIETGKRKDNLVHLLKRLVDEGLVSKVGHGKYQLCTHSIRSTHSTSKLNGDAKLNELNELNGQFAARAYRDD